MARRHHHHHDESERPNLPPTRPGEAVPAAALRQVLAGPLRGDDATRRAAAAVGRQAGNQAMVQRLSVQRNQDWFYGGQGQDQDDTYQSTGNHTKVMTPQKVKIWGYGGGDKTPTKPAWSAGYDGRAQGAAEDKRSQLAAAPHANFKHANEPVHGSHGATHMSSKDVAAVLGNDEEKKKGNWFKRLFRR